MRCPDCQVENQEDSRYCRECASPLFPTDPIPFTHTRTLSTSWRGLSPGAIFAGRYKIIEELGKGGMGRVYRAFDQEVDEYIALKLIRPEIAAEPKTILRFRNELKLARKISHKNVCRMFDLNRAEDAYFITMEFIQGDDLKSSLRRMGPLSMGKAIAIAKQVCDGLGEAHRQGVVHRDLKPQNIMIDREGNARIMDFGIAHSLETEGMTDSGAVMGTPEYMSPEQVDGTRQDSRSDIYSMGAILYEMVTGHVPFEGNTPMSVALKRMTETPLEPRKLNAHINEDLNRVIMRCMVKERAKRYQTTQELHAALSDIARSLPKTDRETAALKPLGSRGITVTFKPKRILLPLVAIGLVVAAGLMVRHFLLKSAEPDLPFPPAQAIQEAAPPETKEEMEPPPAENPPEDKPAAVIPQTQIIPEKTEAPPVRPAVREREEAAQTAEKTGGILREAGRAFQEKRYPECLDLVREALALDPDNAEAMLLASRAERQISSQQILALVDGFIQAMNSGSLPEFYGEACSPELFMRIEDDAEFIVKQYVSFRSVASDVEISFEANDRAEASFSNITTGVRKQGTTPQVIFEGIYTWELERTGRGWRIAKLVFRPIERQQ